MRKQNKMCGSVYVFFFLFLFFLSFFLSSKLRVKDRGEGRVGGGEVTLSSKYIL